MGIAKELIDADADKISSNLTEGLKSCRAVVDNYRTMIGAASAEADEADAVAQAAETEPPAA